MIEKKSPEFSLTPTVGEGKAENAMSLRTQTLADARFGPALACDLIVTNTKLLGLSLLLLRRCGSS